MAMDSPTGSTDNPTVMGLVDDASDDRSCLERGRDTVGQAVDYVQQRLGHYRAAGELAVVFGMPVVRRKIAARIDAALGRPPTPQPEPTVWPHPNDPEDLADLDDPAPRPAPLLKVVPAGPAPQMPTAPAPPAAHGVNGANVAALIELPIPGYDSLSASQVVERLVGLPEGDLAEVRDYESAHRKRRTILGKIDQLRSAP